MILFVDDEKRRMDSYVQDLVLSGHKVEFKSDVDSALEFFAENRTQIKLLILDIMMPTGKSFDEAQTDYGLRTGIAFYYKIREQNPSLPTIIFTDDRCNDLDLFVWEHKNFLVLVAAGNDGKHRSSGTPAIEQGSVSSPGTAKNCLTVGASENNRNGQFSDAYGNWWPDDFPHLPFKSDGMVDSIDDIAAFSSRGPCQNGRRHPDVIAPGTFILSTRSSQIASNHFAWGAYPSAKEHYMYMGGTSMATPMVAGCAALVRQYLRERHQPSIINPSAALIKAALIHSATYINYRFAHPSSQPFADNEQGWGRIKLQQVLNPAEPTQVLFIDEANGLKTGEKAEYKLQISDSQVPLKVTLVYTDYPGEDLINNLNLILYRPTSKYLLGNDFEGEGIPDTVNNVNTFANLRGFNACRHVMNTS